MKKKTKCVSSTEQINKPKRVRERQKKHFSFSAIVSSNNLPSPFETIQFLPFLKNNKHRRESKNNRRYPRATCNTIQTKAAITVQLNVSLNDRSHGRNDTRTGCNTRQMNEKGGRPTYTAPRVAQKFYLDICCSLHASGCTRERLELKINRITTV